MHIYITARHFDLTETIREHVLTHLVHAIERHASAHDLSRIEVQLSAGQRDTQYSCHVLLQLTGNRDINVTEHHHDLYAAIDLTQKRLLTALAAIRESRLTKQRHPRKYSWRKIAQVLRGA